MFRLFRQLRHRLLAENRFRKFLLYAVGEILLVVIGILIAFQIEAWSERQKEASERDEYLASLVDELNQDVQLIGLLLTQVHSDSVYYNGLIHRIEDPGVTLDTILQIMQQEYRPGLTNLWKVNQSTIRSIESTGKAELFCDNVYRALLSHYFTEETVLNNLQEGTDLYYSKLLKYNEGFPFSWSDEENTYLYETLWHIENEKTFVKQSWDMLSFHCFYLNTGLLPALRQRQKNTLGLIGLLREHLEQHN